MPNANAEGTNNMTPLTEILAAAEVLRAAQEKCTDPPPLAYMPNKYNPWGCVLDAAGNKVADTCTCAEGSEYYASVVFGSPEWKAGPPAARARADLLITARSSPLPAYVLELADRVRELEAKPPPDAPITREWFEGMGIPTTENWWADRCGWCAIFGDITTPVMVRDDGRVAIHSGWISRRFTTQAAVLELLKVLGLEGKGSV